jgi:hypothetical protein
MALILKDRVLESSTSSGTGTFTLTGAQTGYQSFSAIGNSNTTYYTIQGKNPDGTLTSEWEVGVGTWSTGNTLARNTVFANSLGTTAKVPFSAGDKDVFVTYPSAKALLGDTSAVSSTGTGSVVLSNSPTITGAVLNGLVVTIEPTAGLYLNSNGLSDTIIGSIGSGFTTYIYDDNVTFYGSNVVFNEITTFNGGISSTGSLSLSGGTAGGVFATNQTTGSILIGGTGATGTITLGRSTESQTTNIQAGATISGETKTINFGTNGAAGSTTNIAIGSTTGTSTTTLNGKTSGRIVPRVSTTTSSATPTINTDNTDQFGLTAQTVDITSFTTNLSGTPTNGQKLWIYIVGTAARAITWGASFESSTATLPTTTVTTNRLDIGFVWNAATSKWRCVAVA